MGIKLVEESDKPDKTMLATGVLERPLKKTLVLGKFEGVSGGRWNYSLVEWLRWVYYHRFNTLSSAMVMRVKF